MGPSFEENWCNWIPMDVYKLAPGILGIAQVIALLCQPSVPTQGASAKRDFFQFESLEIFIES